MDNTLLSSIHQRELTRQRDKEFLDLYHPTLDSLLEQGMPLGKAQRTAVQFTIANGHPHYHVDHERAYRCVCRLMSANEKRGAGARNYRSDNDLTDLPKSRLRRQMWYEITQRVSQLAVQGMSIEAAIDHVLQHCRASRFFITPATALTKICTQTRTRALRS
jgi:LmbE family N-acetylglucosaminyl deacetylase